ncbi:MAG: hypothetical protein AAGK02_09310 [Pseudomonadota bacterium]
MTKHDHAQGFDDEQGLSKRTIKIVLGAIAYLIALAILITGESALEGVFSGTTNLVILLVAAITVIVLTVLWLKEIYPSNDEPVAASTRKSGNILILSGALGAVLAVGLMWFGDVDDPSQSIFSNAAISPTIAFVVGAAYLIGLPLVGWFWHRTIDEHEMAANQAGALVGIYAYALIAPLWWIGERASLLPPQEPMIVFVIVMAAYTVTWMIKRG